jgi:NitT/TauT family transport system substrate-binding protein
VARARSGINAPDQLAGKRVGVVMGGSSQYVLDMYLLTVGIEPRQLTVVGLEPEEMLAALQAGSVDAVAVWDPFAYNAIKALGADAVLLPNASAYVATFNLVVPRRLARENDAALVKLLRAIDRAERFIQDRPDEAKAILRARLNVDQAFVAWTWPTLSYRLGIDQSLVTTMESEARWALREGHVKTRATTNTLGLLHTGPLKRIKPAAVGVEP